MAPCHVSVDSSTDNLKSKISIRHTRKPVVEKMRRDRINSSIKQLRLLLENEFQRHQPNSKLEKADILEMTVNYLKQQQHLQMNANLMVQKSPLQDYNQGYNRCLDETLQFLSYTEKQKPTNTKIIQHLNSSLFGTRESPITASSTKNTASNSTTVVWRPW
ncbi:transcription factor HES-5 [Bombina bombina]|uniref:transcription factor HES-5 n=1 Tax=Bombina bombina TaxID=8345 RepID=UPI00235AD7D9|nr:transcription factor HES-5 [Bombina bombina]